MHKMNQSKYTTSLLGDAAKVGALVLLLSLGVQCGSCLTDNAGQQDKPTDAISSPVSAPKVSTPAPKLSTPAPKVSTPAPKASAPAVPGADDAASGDGSATALPAITQAMIGKASNFAFKDVALSLSSAKDKKDRLLEVLNEFLKAQPLSPTYAYKEALLAALEMEDEEILQALLARKSQVEGSENMISQVVYSAIRDKKMPKGLPNLLSLMTQEKKIDMLKGAIRFPSLATIHVLLDPAYNLQAAELMAQEIVETAFDKVASVQDPTVEAKGIVEALLSNPLAKQKGIKIKKGMLDKIIIRSNVDNLELVEGHADMIEVTDHEAVDLLTSFRFYEVAEYGGALQRLLNILKKAMRQERLRDCIRQPYGGLTSSGSVVVLDEINDKFPTGLAKYKPIFEAEGLL
jgi:hypothetical protein